MDRITLAAAPPLSATLHDSLGQRMENEAGFRWSPPLPDPDVLARNEIPFPGRTEYGQIGRLSYRRIIASPHRVERQVNDGERGWLKILYQLRGEATLLQDGRERRLEPGEWTMYDLHRCYSVVNHTEVEQLVLLLPPGALPPETARWAGAEAATFGRAGGMGRLTSALIKAVVDDLPLTAGGHQSELGEALIAMLRVAYQERRDARAPVTTSDARCEKILSFVNFHLANPELSVASIADALGCSKRHVHRLFRTKGMSLNEYIRNERLDCCKAELTDPRRRGRTITEIGLSWGFNSGAHFSTQFRKRFNQTPIAARRMFSQSLQD